MNKIYVVSTGSYSDYCIHGVFSTREKAERYKKERARMEWDDTNEIEEFDVDLYDKCVLKTLYTIEQSLGTDLTSPYEQPYFKEDSYENVDFLDDAEIHLFYDYRNMIFRIRITAITKELARGLYNTYGQWIGTVRDRIDTVRIKDGVAKHLKYQDGEYVQCNS